MNIQAPFTFSSVVSLGVWRCAGLRLRVVVVDLGKLVLFCPLALIPLGLVALVFVVRDSCGHGRFLALGLTRRSSRPAFGGRLGFFVRIA